MTYEHQDNTGCKRQGSDSDMGNCERDVDGRGLNGIARGEHGPVSDSAKHELKAEGDFEIASGAAEVLHFAETRGDGENRPEDHEGDDSGADEVRNDAEGVVTERGAQDDLNENEQGGQGGERAQLWRVFVAQLWDVTCPPLASENSKAHRDNKKYFGERGVGRGDGRSKKSLHREAAEERLSNHEQERANAKDPDPLARFTKPNPHGEDERKNRDGASDKAVAPLPADTTDHRRECGAIGERPRGNRQAGLIAGDEGTRDNEKKSATRGENGETMKIAIPCFSQKTIVLRL